MKDDNTYRTILSDSHKELIEAKEKIAEVNLYLDQGRITREKRVININGPWCFGSIYKSDLFSLTLYIATKVDESPIPEIESFSKLIYICIQGSCYIYLQGGNYVMGRGSCLSIDLGLKYTLEPKEVNTQLLECEVKV
jgi:hypothetical protein